VPHREPRLKASKQRIRYPDANFALPIAVLEHVTRTPIENVSHTTIFEPLAMQQTLLPGRSMPRVAAPEPATL
jgi:CubicO group peptidase (beta-lactamase class C family)